MNGTEFRPARQLKPVSGNVKVLRPIGEFSDYSAEIEINGKVYLLTRLATGYRLTGHDNRGQVTTYDIPHDLSSCDCPDATYHPDRPGGCKHRKALGALKASGHI